MMYLINLMYKNVKV